MGFTDTLTGFDWVVLTLVGLLALIGLMRGFTHELIGLAGWVVAIIAVRLGHEGFTLWLAPRTGGEASAATIAFILLFFGTLLAARLVASAAGGMAKRSLLGPFDRVLGLGFGALKGVILASALFLIAQFMTGLFDDDRVPPAWLGESRSAPLLALTANAMVGWVHDMAAKGSAPGEPSRPGLPPGLTLPPGHPPLDGPFGPSPPGAVPDRGYSAEDRQALERLLQEGAKAGDEVEI
ncbi:MAG: CvpA family protein [Sphingomonadaceae bacterium]